MTPWLTVGMAHYDDFDQLQRTIQSLRAHHNCSEGVEFVVCDNSPFSAHGIAVQKFLHKIDGRYIACDDVVGTSAPRDRVFREATAPIVLCLDCHVELLPGAVAALRNWWAAQPADSPDMITGPIVHDDFSLLATHFNAMWRCGMYGVWGTAWRCPCQSLGVRPQTGDDRPPVYFSPVQDSPGGLRHPVLQATANPGRQPSGSAVPGDDLHYVELLTQQPVWECERCGSQLPPLPWTGHERELRRQGFECLAEQPEPFEILGHGLGLFSMRKDAWIGFHPQARGFGGEELYAHEKVRRAGGRVWCLPGLRWWHNFAKVGGVSYPLSNEGKTRNYVLEWDELGWDRTPIRDHFVGNQLITPQTWEAIAADPRRYDSDASAIPRPVPAAVAEAWLLQQPPAGQHNLDSLFAWCGSVPRDLNEHADTLRAFSRHAQHATILAQRREWDVYVLAGRPAEVVTYTSERDPLHDTLHQVIARTEINRSATRRVAKYTVYVDDPLGVPAIADTDFLCVDAVGRENDLEAALNRHAGRVSKWLAVQGCREIVETWATRNRWSIVKSDDYQFGLTVIWRPSPLRKD